MPEGKFPLIFPWKFTEFAARFVKCTDIKDTLAFSNVGDSLLCTDIGDDLTFSTTKDSITFGNTEDTIRFTKVNI